MPPDGEVFGTLKYFPEYLPATGSANPVAPASPQSPAAPEDSGRPGRSLERAPATPHRHDDAPRRNVRHPGNAPSADCPDSTLRIRETARSGPRPPVTCPDAASPLGDPRILAP